PFGPNQSPFKEDRGFIDWLGLNIRIPRSGTHDNQNSNTKATISDSASTERRMLPGHPRTRPSAPVTRFLKNQPPSDKNDGRHKNLPERDGRPGVQRGGERNEKKRVGPRHCTPSKNKNNEHQERK